VAERQRRSNDGEAPVTGDEVLAVLQLEEWKGECVARFQWGTVAARAELTGGNGSAATLRPEIWWLEASPMGRTGRKVEGRKGGVRAAEGKRNGERKGGEGRGGAAVLCRCTEVGRTIDGVVPHSRRGSRERERRGVPPRPAGGALLAAARGRRARVVWRGHASRLVRAGEGEGG
jgi:hypothetical protein